MNVDYLERISQEADAKSIMERVAATVATQVILADRWVWSEKDLAAWEAEVDAIQNPMTGWSVRRETEVTARDLAEGALETALKTLHDSTVSGVSIVRIRWRRQPERLLVLAGLSASGTTAAEILEEAERWELAWEEIDPAWEPVAGLTLTVFQVQIAAARAAQREVRRGALRTRLVTGQYGMALHAINDAAQAWYAEATATFRQDRSASELLDSIPTTYVARYYEAAKRRRAARRPPVVSPPAAPMPPAVP